MPVWLHPAVWWADQELMKRTVIVAVAAVAVLSGCGGSTLVAGKSLAQQACLGSGQQAASYAAQAAAANPQAYSTLSADVAALATQDASRVAGATDGDPSDDAGLGAIAAADGVGSGAYINVMTDCIKAGLSVTHH
jgi:hypothetical protein